LSTAPFEQEDPTPKNAHTAEDRGLSEAPMPTEQPNTTDDEEKNNSSNTEQSSTSEPWSPSETISATRQLEYDIVTDLSTTPFEQEDPTPKKSDTAEDRGLSEAPMPTEQPNTTGDEEKNHSSTAPEEQEDPKTRRLSGAHVSDTFSPPLQDETTTRKSGREEPTLDHSLARWMSPTKIPLSTDQVASNQENQEEHSQTASWDATTELLVHLSTDIGLKLSFLAPEELREPASTPLDDTAKQLLGKVLWRNQLRSIDWPDGCHRLKDPHQQIKLHRIRRIKTNSITKQQLDSWVSPTELVQSST
jgi:hypothetical protein